MYRHLLVALGNGDYRNALAWKAVEFARTIGARISFFAMPTDTQSDTQPASAPPASKPASEAFVHRAGELATEMLTKAEAVARALGVACSSITVSAADPCQVLAQVAAAGHCDIVALSNHGAGNAHWKMLDSAAMAGLPALVFAVEQPAPSSEQARAIELLRAGQECVSMMLHLWLRLLDAAETRRIAADEEAMKTIAAYLQSLAASGHHAGKHEPLFHRLRERTAVVNAELEELERQHALDGKLLAALNATLASHAAGNASLGELKTAVSAYASFAWQHAGREEGVIIPTAQRYLREQDWAQIAAAVGQDWPESRATDGEAARLLSRIIDAAALSGR
jgi:hemerythrin-like domain-containing protein/nucleotide-binding universal stress UspA family protein